MHVCCRIVADISTIDETWHLLLVKLHPMYLLHTHLILHRDYTTPLAIPPEEWIWWTTMIPSYKVLARSDIPAKGEHAAGISYDSFNLSPLKYLQYLLTTAVKLGVKCRTTTVQAISELFSMPGFENLQGVVNCTGLGASKLVRDPALFPTKGQSVIVRGQADRIATGLGDDWEAVVVPRYGVNETFLGVSKVFGDGYVAFLVGG